MKNMNNGYKLGLAAIAASISLVGCSSDSTSDTTSDTTSATTVTGQFVDTYVEGLNYTCSSGTTGVTNSDGEYTCNVGDTVEFSLGGYVLGTATASSGIVTPEALYPEDPVAALNVAQLIQTLDTDPDDDIITIPEAFTELDDVNATPEDGNFETLIEDTLGEPLVLEEDAQAHLDETELMLLLAGKTFYNVGADFLDELVFNADLTSATWTAIASNDSEPTDTDALTLEGEKLYVNGEVYIVLTAEADDYLLFDVFEIGNPVRVDQARFYFDQTKAEEYFATLPDGYTVITEAMLTAQPFYDEDQDDLGFSRSEMTFTATTLTRHEIWYDTATPTVERTNESFTLSYEIVRGKVRVNLIQFNEGYKWFTLTGEVDGVIPSWELSEEDDYDEDTFIDNYGSTVWYLSKPDGWPDFTIQP